MYASKFKIPEEKLMNRLWGDNYYDAKAKTWKKDGYDKDGVVIPRAFC